MTPADRSRAFRARQGANTPLDAVTVLWLDNDMTNHPTYVHHRHAGPHGVTYCIVDRHLRPVLDDGKVQYILREYGASLPGGFVELRTSSRGVVAA